MKSRSYFLVLFCVFGGLVKVGAQVTATWTGLSNTLWSNSNNWVASITPVPGSLIEFNGSGAGVSVLDLSLSSLESITFQNTSALFLNATGGATFNLSGGSNGVFFATNSNVNLNVPIAGANTNLWLNGGTGTLTLNPGTGSNTFSGSTEIFAGGTLADGEANSYSANSVMYVGSVSSGTGTVLVNFNETIDGLNDGGPNGSVQIANGMTLTLTGVFSTTFSGVISDISGHGSLTMNGPGTLTLEGANSYSGTTTINSGGTINIGGGTATGSIVSNVVGVGTGGLSFDRTNAYTYGGNLSGTLNVAQEGTGTTTLTGTNVYTGPSTVINGTLQAGSTSAFGGPAGLGTMTVNSSGTLSTSGFDNTIGALNGSGNVSLGSNALTLASTLNVGTFSGVIAGTGGTLVMNGYVEDLTGANTYTGGTTINGGTLEVDNSVGSATGTGTITIGASGTLQIGNGDANGVVSPTAAIVDNGSVKFFRSDSPTFSNTITGTGGVGMFGFASEVLSGTNVYSGETESFRGTLVAGSTSAFGGSGLSPLVFDGVGSTVNLNGFSNTVGSITAASTGNFLALGSATLTIADTTANTTFAGVISGSGGYVSIAQNSLILTGANTYTGGTSITHGVVLVANSSGSGLGTGPVNISPGAILDIGAGSTAGSVGATVITDNGSLNFNRSDQPVYSAAITGSGTVSTNGGGVQLTGDDTYTGLTSINSGTVTVGNGSVVGSRIAGNVYVGSGAALGFAPATGDNYTFSGAITGAGSVTFGGPGSITLSNSNNSTYSGPTYVNGGNLSDGAANSFSPNSGMLVNSGGGSLTVNYNETLGDLENGGSGGPVFIVSGMTLTTNGINNPGPFMGTISGPGGLNFNTSTGSQGLGGANTYTGGTTMTSGEIFVSSSTVGAPGSITSGPLGTNTLTFIGSGEMSSIINPVTLANAINLNSYNLDNDDATTNLTLTGPISGVGGSITWCTNNILALINTNTFTGGVDMRLGQLALGSDTGAGVGGTIILDSGTDLYTYGGTGITRTVANPIDFTGSTAALGNNDDNYLVLTGGISGSGAVAFQGGSTGTLTLSPSTNTFNGAFEIASGTVYAANNNAFGSATAILLNGGTTLNVEGGVAVSAPIVFSGSPNTLAGSGTISSAVATGSSSIISPSASPGGGPGTLTFASGLVLGTGTAIHFDLYNATGSAGTGFSLINAPGGLDLTASNNTITFNIVSTNSTGGAANAINFNAATPFSWMFASSSTTITGFSPLQFNLVTSGFTNNTSGGTFGVSEVGNNLFLNFTPVPEPSTWALMGAGALALIPLGLRRRRLGRT